MDFCELKNKLSLAVMDFLKNDKYLLEIDVNERTITFRLAHYLQIYLGASYYVDCEYNKNLGVKKRFIWS